MDAENGEKIEVLAEFFRRLLADARERNLLRDHFYFLGDQVLAKFKMFQGFEPTFAFPGSRLEQAYLIWRQCPKRMRDALLKSAGA
jgi:hypothetical protein